MSAFPFRAASVERRISRIPIDSIHPGAHQPRRHFDEAQLRTLADSIRLNGMINPLLVRRLGSGFELIAGERRLRALELLGYSHAEAIITAAPDRDCALIGLIENLQREDLHFLEEAEACRRILREEGLSQEELAAALSRSPSALANLLRVLRLGKDVRKLIWESGLSERHARTLLRLENEDQQLSFARRAVQDQLSVRQLEAAIELHLAEKKPAKKTSGVLRDNRLVINALKDAVRQLKRIGIPASSRVENHDGYYEVIITIRTTREAQ